jgi:hypothetical protein
MATYDAARRAQSTRRGRERGCSVYIAAEELARAGISLDGPPPLYRARGYRRSRNGHTVIVSLYTER